MSIDSHEIKNTILNFIIPIVCAVATLVIFFVVIYPSISKTPELQKELESKEMLANQLTTKLGKLNNLLDYNSVVNENLNLVSTLLVTEAAVPELLTQVDTIANEAGLEVQRLNYSTSSETSTAAALTVSYTSVTMGLQGNFFQLINFLTALENAARIVKVDDIRYNTAEIDDVETLSINLTLDSPYLFVQSDAITDDPIAMDITDPKFIEFLNRIKSYRIY